MNDILTEIQSFKLEMNNKQFCVSIRQTYCLQRRLSAVEIRKLFGIASRSAVRALRATSSADLPPKFGNVVRAPVDSSLIKLLPRLRAAGTIHPMKLLGPPLTLY